MEMEEATNLNEAEDVNTEAETEVEETVELDEYGNPVESDETDETDPEDELEEIERDGKKYKIPAALKSELMMQADYTRKTQELAEQRKAIQEQRSLVEQASQAELNAYASLTNIDQQLAEYQKVNWDRYEDDNPFEAQKDWRRFQTLQQHLFQDL